MKYKVFIPAAGIGNPEKNSKSSLNKALVTVGLKPGISYIIEKFPKDIVFVIALGYQAETLKDFLELAYPERKFEFVTVDKFEGTGSGLGYTMLKCKDKLQCPFIFSSSDTIVDEKIPEPSLNWMGYAEVEDSKEYRTIQFENNKILDINKKGTFGNDNAYIGLSGIYDYIEFWKIMTQQEEIAIEIGETLGLKEMIPTGIKPLKFTWHDTGNQKALEETRKKMTTPDYPNILPKSDEAIWFIENNVIKYHKDPEFISRRVERVKYLNSYVPKVINSRKNFYMYEKVEGEIFSEKAMPTDFIYLLDWLENFWIKKELTSKEKEEFKKTCNNFYQVKTIQRVKQYFKEFEQIDTEETINGVKIPKILDLLNEVDWDWICDGIATRFHGDLHFENILITENSKMPFTLLDWRQCFGETLEFGDIYYDLAKLNHGLIISHELINKNLFKVNKKTNNIEFDFLRKRNLVECENYLKKFVEKKGYDYKKVEIMTSLIYLNIAALHHYPYSSLLFYLGKSGLYNGIHGK